MPRKKVFFNVERSGEDASYFHDATPSCDFAIPPALQQEYVLVPKPMKVSTLKLQGFSKKFKLSFEKFSLFL